nr:hypothetical protein [Nocardioides ungokensis]
MGGDTTLTDRWDRLREQVAEHGLRNSLLVAIAPTATIASIVGCYECIEPQVSNLFKRETLSGEFLQVNAALVRELRSRGLWTTEVREQVKRQEGSVQGIAAIPEDVRHLFRTAWELPQRALVDMAAARQPYIDQSQSLNLFLQSPTIGKLSSMYLHAWKAGLKTTYYLRSRPATRIQQTTVAAARAAVPDALSDAQSDSGAVACSLENPRPVRPANDDDHRHECEEAAARPGMNLTLRPMRYPHFYERYRDAIRTPGPSRRSTCTPTSRTSRSCPRPSGTLSRGWWPSSPPATRSWPTTWC